MLITHMNWKCFSSHTIVPAQAKIGAMTAAHVVLIRSWSLESSTGAGWEVRPFPGNAQGQKLLLLSGAPTYAECMSAKWRACLVLSVQLHCHWQLKHVFHCVDMHDKLQKKLWLLILSFCIPAFRGRKIQLSLMKGLHSGMLVRYVMFCYIHSDDLSWNNPALTLESCKWCFSYSIYCDIYHLRSQRIFFLTL